MTQNIRHIQYRFALLLSSYHQEYRKNLNTVLEMWSRTVRTNNDGSAVWCWSRKYRLNVHIVAANDDDSAIYIKYNIHGKMYHVSVQYSTVLYSTHFSGRLRCERKKCSYRAGKLLICKN